VPLPARFALFSVSAQVGGTPVIWTEGCWAAASRYGLSMVTSAARPRLVHRTALIRLRLTPPTSQSLPWVAAIGRGPVGVAAGQQPAAPPQRRARDQQLPGAVPGAGQVQRVRGVVDGGGAVGAAPVCRCVVPGRQPPQGRPARCRVPAAQARPGSRSVLPRHPCRTRKGRKFLCPHCGLQWHRDLVGAANIAAKAGGGPTGVGLPTPIEHRRVGIVPARRDRRRHLHDRRRRSCLASGHRQDNPGSRGCRSPCVPDLAPGEDHAASPNRAHVA
jgi:Putative transposase DNA-binding domain